MWEVSSSLEHGVTGKQMCKRDNENRFEVILKGTREENQRVDLITSKCLLRVNRRLIQSLFYFLNKKQPRLRSRTCDEAKSINNNCVADVAKKCQGNRLDYYYYFKILAILIAEKQ